MNARDDRPGAEPLQHRPAGMGAGVPGITRASPVDASLDWLIGPMPRPPSRWRTLPARWVAVLRRRPLAVLLGVMLLLGAIVLIAALAHRSAPSDRPVHRIQDPAARPPHIDAPFAPAALRPLTPVAAIAWNAAAPLSTAPNPPGVGFVEPLTNATDYQHSLECMTMAIYYEAGNESDDGQRAVAQVVLNRMRHVAYPHTVCGVVFQGAQHRNACQFTFACDGAMNRTPAALSWRRAALVATAALGGYVYAPVGLATHYHADYVVPYWAASLDKVTTIGAHIFYRWDGAWGRRGAFTAAYAGGEPALPFLANPALAVEPGAAVDTAPVEVVAAERPVIIAGAAAPAADGKPMKNAQAPKATVGLEDRWIVPHDVDPAAPPVEPPASARSVILKPDAPN